MKKIGLITFWKDNYGSALQCYATKSIIQKMGYNCEVLVYEPHGEEKYISFMKRAFERLWQSITAPGFYKHYSELRRNSKNTFRDMPDSVKFSLELFCQSVLQPRGYGRAMLKKLGNSQEYTAFIAGSDQIWNGAAPVDSFYFLAFAPDNKKIAFAPSFGTSKVMNYNRKRFENLIKKFRYLSVREEDGIKNVHSLTGRYAQRISDPVVMIDKKGWTDFSEGGIVHVRPYILLFFLNKPDNKVVETIQNIANYEKKKYDTLCFVYKYDNFFQIEGYRTVEGGPKDYLSLISHAEFIFTDSFHTALFSIIFNRSFYVFPRNYGHSCEQTSRLRTLLRIYKCKNRMIWNENAAKNIEITPLHDCSQILEKERNRAIKFLEASIASCNNNRGKIGKKGIPELRELCTGCCVCETVCPTGAIKMKEHPKGYMIPEIDVKRCISCGKCERYCNTVLNFKKIKKTAYVAYAKDKMIRDSSASGGMFQILARYTILKGGIVFGAGILYENNHIEIRHLSAETEEELYPLLNSKYVESNCSGIYTKVLKELKKGRMVLYSGTSCQIEGLKRYLQGKEYSNLYTIDLICHGVPGRYLYHNYISYLEEKYKSKITGFSFRNKKLDDLFTERIQFIDGEKAVQWKKSPYYRMFFEEQSYRDCCYQCQYSSVHKPSDITLGDYFEVNQDYPELFKQGEILEKVGNPSSVIIHTAQGVKLIDECREHIRVHEVDVDRVQLSHRQLCIPSVYTHQRERLFKLYKEGGFKAIQQYYWWKDFVEFLPKTFVLMMKKTEEGE